LKSKLTSGIQFVFCLGVFNVYIESFGQPLSRYTI